MIRENKRARHGGHQSGANIPSRNVFDFITKVDGFVRRHPFSVTCVCVIAALAAWEFSLAPALYEHQAALRGWK